jgi:hypothetical protein
MIVMREQLSVKQRQAISETPAKGGGGGLVETGFSSLGRMAAFPGKRPWLGSCLRKQPNCSVFAGSKNNSPRPSIFSVREDYRMNDPAGNAGLAPARRRRTAKYICLGYTEPGKFEGMSQDERHRTFDECFEYNDHLRANGILSPKYLFSLRRPR